MNFRIISKLLGALTFFIALSMGAPLAVSLLYGDGDATAFLYSMATAGAAGALLYLPARKEARPVTHIEGFAMVTLAWAAMCAAGALPYLFTGALSNPADAVFESVSGFTTTGSTVMTEVETQSHGILFWRSLTQWLGGMGIIVLSVAVLPLLGVGGMQLFKAEAPGPTKDRLTPRIAETARALWKAYVILTAAEAGLLVLAGMSGYEAICHAFTTMATGGFGLRNLSIESYGSAAIEWIVIVFMFLAGVNFALHHRALLGAYRGYWADREFRGYAFIILSSAAVCAVVLYFQSETPIGVHDAVRGAAFQVVSVATTTGYSSANFEAWPPATLYILLALMFAGGSAGSTAGGIKTVRVIILLKHAYRELVRLVHPGLVTPIRLGRHAVPREVADAVVGFFFLYMTIFVLASTAMALLGLDVVTAFSSVAATLGNIGPGLGGVGPYDNFQWIPDAGKWVLILCMLLGRLEIFTVLLLFVPAYWRR